MLNGKVPTGSITAPRIANRVMYDFDEELVDELSKIQKVRLKNILEKTFFKK